MPKKTFWSPTLATLAFCLVVQIASSDGVYSQGGGNVTPEVIAQRIAIENELQSIAIVERKLVPMRDGKRIATDVYRPKDRTRKYPAIFVRTPYNFKFWDVRNGAPRDLSNELEAVKRGYAFVGMNARGRFFSEGNYDTLGPPLSDGVEELTWIAKQPVSVRGNDHGGEGIIWLAVTAGRLDIIIKSLEVEKWGR